MQIPFGVAEAKNEELLGLEEKPTLTFSVNAGIYVLSPHAIRLVPCDKPFPITDLFREGLRRGLKIGACVIEDDWLDVGQFDELRRARGDL